MRSVAAAVVGARFTPPRVEALVSRQLSLTAFVLALFVAIAQGLGCIAPWLYWFMALWLLVRIGTAAVVIAAAPHLEREATRRLAELDREQVANLQRRS